ncbi:MAG: MFS transporter [Acidipropionibacterium sp.]|jgi:EmrB/QacA subfamily drug resistance transporter|nr:MFS transporter [Acidipropionibacterium sp.]
MTEKLKEPEKVASSPAKSMNVTLLFAGLLVTMLLASLNQTVLSTALPTIIGELNGVEHMAWVVTVYILASTIMMPVYGKISDLLGRRPVLITAILLFVAGSVIGALAGTFNWLIIGRGIQGLGGGGLMILSQAAIADVVPARERGKYMGIMGAVFAVSSVAGPLLGGWFTEGPGWRWVFWINVPLGLLAVLAAALFLKIPKPKRTERLAIDYLGMTLVAAATTAVVLVCSWGGGTYEWESPQIIGLIAAAVVLAVAFVIAETKVTDPVIPMSFFKDRNFTLATVAALLIGIAMFGVISYMPTYIQMVTGVDATVAGLLMIPMMGGLLVASVGSGAAVTRTGKYKMFPILGAAIMGLGLFLLSTLDVNTATWIMCSYLAIMGIGIGLAQQLLTLIVQNSFPAKIVGTATAANNYFRQVGATVGSAVVGSIFAINLKNLITDKMSGMPGAGAGSGVKSLTPAIVDGLPEPIRKLIIESYNEALLPIYLFLVPLAVLAVIVLCFVKEKRLATEVEREVTAEALAEGHLAAMPAADDIEAATNAGSAVQAGLSSGPLRN